MKNKNLFALSPALILENFKMYWYLPVLSLIIYFFGGIFPIITNYDNLYSINYLIQNNFNNLSLVFIPLLIIVPLTAACIAMSFFHRENRALAMHAQPYSKSRLFNSQVASGWLMCILPLLVMALLYLCFMKEVAPDVTSSVIPHTPEDNVYTAAAVFGWLGDSVVIATFFYGMFVLAGALVGTVIMQVLLSGVMFVILPLMIFIVNAFCDSFLLGYVGMSDFAETLMRDANPLLRLVFGWGTGPGLQLELAYLLAGVLMLVLARFAYGRAKLEKVGDSMIFMVMEELITYLIVFVGMTAFGWIFYNMAASTKTMLVFGMAVGSLITFLVVKIILAKSIKVFNKRNLISLCIYLVAAALFTGLTVFDIGGFAKRLPDEDAIQSVELSDSTFRIGYENSYYCDDLLLKDGSKPVMSTDSAVISAMYELEKYIVENERYATEAIAYDTASYERPLEGQLEYAVESISFTYKMKNGTSFKRRYFVSIDNTIVELLNKIVASEDLKSYYRLADKLNLAEFDSAMLSVYSDDEEGYRTNSDEGTVLSRRQLEKLIEAKDSDITDKTYYEMLKSINLYDDSRVYDVNITVSVLNKDYKEKTGKSLYDSASLSFTVMSSNKNTLAYLHKLGVI
ncbi:MAG: hypothetical protein MR440_03450 [Firmicutes bacterium]|nr:hypothetical protein [Bacillota bacterium]